MLAAFQILGTDVNIKKKHEKNISGSFEYPNVRSIIPNMRLAWTWNELGNGGHGKHKHYLQGTFKFFSLRALTVF